VNLVFQNPFRTLGLLAGASSRDIAQRVAELRVRAAVGQVPVFVHDQPGWPAIDRSLSAVEAAAAAVEDSEGRWFHGLFWFRANDPIDELALESLSAGRATQALRLWDQRIARGGREVSSCLINRAVLSLALGCAPAAGNPALLRAGLDGLGHALADHALAVRGELPASRWSELMRRLVSALLAESALEVGGEFGPERLDLIAAMGRFPAEVREGVHRALTLPVFERLERAIEHPDKLDEALDAFTRLRRIVGTHDQRLQVIANQLAAAYFFANPPSLGATPESAEPQSQMLELAETLPVMGRVLDEARAAQTASDPPARELPAEVLSAEVLSAEVLSAEVLSAEVLPADGLPAEALPAEALPASELPISPPPITASSITTSSITTPADAESSVEPVVESDADPWVEPSIASETLAESVEEPIFQPILQPTLQPIDEPSVEPITEALAPAVTEPIPAAAAEPPASTEVPLFLRTAQESPQVPSAAADPVAEVSLAMPGAAIATELAAKPEAPATAPAFDSAPPVAPAAPPSTPPSDSAPPVAPAAQPSAPAMDSAAPAAPVSVAPDRSAQIAAAKRSLAERMQGKLLTIEEAATLIDAARPDLTKLKALLGREDPQYLLACDALAALALDHLVPMVDSERERFELVQDRAAARSVLDRAEVAARKLAMLDLGAEARERVARFLGALRDLIEHDTAALSASGPSGRLGAVPKLAVGAGLAAASLAAVIAWLMGG